MLSCREFAAVIAATVRYRARSSIRIFSIVLCAAQCVAPNARTQSSDDPGQLRVVGGSPAELSAFPSMVAVTKVSEDGRPIGLCGGTVIDSHWVLTAAHCIVDRNHNVATASSFRVIEGTVNWRSGGTTMRVARVVPHSEYDHPPHANDIALLELAQPSRVQPQMLASYSLRSRLTRPGNKATVTGWGDTAAHRSAPLRAAGERDLATELLQVTMPVVSLEQCRKTYGTGLIHNHNVCAGLEEGGVDSCQGDSGGPLFTQHPTVGNVQIGVVSWGAGCAQPGQWGVYTSVGDFEPFIQRYVPNASFAKELNSSDGALGDAQPHTMPPPGDNPQVNVDVLPAGPIHLNTPVTVRVSSSDAGFVMLFARDADGHVTQLFPNRFASTNSSALVAGRQIRAGATMTVPGPADGFRIKAQAPVGDTVVIAIVAPPDAKVADLVERHQGLEVIDNWDGFVSQLADRLRAASEARAAQTGSGASGSRALGVEQARPAIAMAERSFTVLP